MGSKTRKSAKGEECQIRIPGVCNFDAETTVLAHKNGAGIAIKSSDAHAAYTCSACHDVIDGRCNPKHGFTDDDIRLMFYDGIFRTQLILIEKGLIIVE